MDFNLEVWKTLGLAFCRWVLQAFGLLLIKWGVVDQGFVNGWVEPAAVSLLGAAIIGGTALWKYVRVRMQKKTLEVALESQPISLVTAQNAAAKQLSAGT